MPWTFPLGLVSGVLMSECASIQSTPPGAVHRREPAERPERDRVVAAEDERDRAGADLLDDLRGDALARRLDLGQEARALVLQRGRLGDGRLDVPVVADVVARGSARRSSSPA